MAISSRRSRRKSCALRWRRLIVEQFEPRILLSSAPSGSDTIITTVEDTPYVFGVADFGFTDPGDTPADLFVAVEITTLPTAGTLKLAGNPVSAGNFVPTSNISSRSYLPAANANGSPYATLTFQVQDSGISNNLDLTPNTLKINVTPVNDPPAAVNFSLVATGCNGYLAISKGPGVSGYASDVDGDPLTLEIVTPPLLGTLSFQPNGMFTYNRPAGPGFNGFTYRAFDGKAYSNVATVSFTPQATNCPPNTANESFITL